METILNYFGLSAGVIAILAVFIEIAPVKVNPLGWLGKRFNGETLEEVKKINDKLDEHIAQSYRSKILNFQTELINDGISNKPLEKWVEVINAADKYEEYVKENKLNNGMCEQAIKFINRSYQKCLSNRDFANVDGDNAQTQN